MRLAFVTSHPIQYQAPLFRELAGRPGVDFTALFCTDHGVRPTLDREFGRVIQWNTPLLEGYRHRFLPNVSPRPAVTSLGQLNPELLHLIRRGEFDAVVLHGYAVLTTFLAPLWPRTRTRLLLRVESHLLEPRPWWKRAIKQPLLRGLFRRIDHFLPIGAMNREYLRSFGVQDRTMTLAPYTVDNDFFARGSELCRVDRAAVRRRFELPVDRPVFLFAAKLIEKKRPLDLVRALARAGLQGRATVAYVGDGALGEALTRETDALGLRSSVVRLGFRNQTEMPEIYGCADALVLPSDIEPWGLAVNEAMASGTPAIVTDVVGCGPDLVRDPECIYRPGDVDALARALTRAVDDPAWLARLRASAVDRIARWGIPQTADGILAGARKAA
jgi:glycosyltransferase involved in cell wall biosynthesis